MNLIEQLQTDVARHQRQLEERLKQLAEEQAETKKVLRSVVAYRAKLEKQHPNGEATLPLGDPDEEPAEAKVDDEVPFYGYDEPDEPEEPTVEEYQASREPARVTPESLMAGERSERARRRKAKEAGNG